MLEVGFLGTQAPLYMDMITIYFGLLPFLMGYAILMAVKKKYDLHYKMQLAIFFTTLVFVVIFEIGVRVSGGFDAFMDNSSANYMYLSIFLIIHILIAIASVVLWATIIYTSMKQYKSDNKMVASTHKKLGKLVYLGMSITSIMGITIYYYLFVYAGAVT